jgi:hypothetical protein
MDQKHPTPSWPVDNYGIYHESKEGNQVVNKFKFLNLYAGDCKNGRHYFFCPIKLLENIIGVYTESSDLFPYGRINCVGCNTCHHSPLFLYEKIGANFYEIVNKSLILLNKGIFSEILSALEYELRRCDDIYKRKGKLVQIRIDNITEQIIITELLAEDIRKILSKRCKFLKRSNDKNEYILCNLPIEYCNTIYKTQKHLMFKEVNGIAMQPYLRPDGSLVTTPGYDLDTKVFSQFTKDKYKIKSEPTREDGENSLLGILDLFSEFSFASEVDKSAAISAVLTSTVRISLSHAPMCHCNGSQAGTGKTYLMKCVASFATPFPVASIEFPNSNEECSKKMFALLRNGTPAIFLDNVNSDLPPYPCLCSILTDESISDRILRRSETSEVSTRALFLSNGNNVMPQKDLIRRIITFTLLPTCEFPATRKFIKDPLFMIKIHRAYYISLVLTMIRAWIVAGEPQTDVPPVPSYKDWSNWCRQVLLWLGLPDPADSLFRALDNDPDRQILKRFLHAWYDSFESQSVMLRDAIEKGNIALKEVFADINGGKNLNRWRLGVWLSKHSGCTVDKLTLEKDNTITLSAGSWRVISK